MSTSLLVMAPFVLLAIVSSLCFVGCFLNTRGNDVGEEPGPVFKYSEDTVLAEGDRLLAFWRLNEGSGPTADNAASSGVVADGEYKSESFDADPIANSAEVLSPTLNFGQPGILSGDLQSPFTAGSTRQPCIYVEGGYVSVKWSPVIAPSEADGFTIEAWVHPGWGGKDLEFDRAVVGSVESVGGYRGFGILAGKKSASEEQTWKAFVGNGTDVTYVTGAVIDDLDKIYHLVATYKPGEPGKPGELTLYVNGGPSAMSATYVPTTGVGAPDIPSRLYIGAGGTHALVPKIPFVGKIQCVALYRGAFSDADVQKHLNDGNAIP